MFKNFHARLQHADSNPDNRGENRVLDWIDEAEGEDRRWARNLLVGFGILVLVLLVLIRTGWLLG